MSSPISHNSILHNHYSDLTSTKIYNKHGHLWECIEATPNKQKSGKGTLYTFQFRSTFRDPNALRSKLSDIYPAIEPSISDASSHLNDPKMTEALWILGYCFEGDQNESFITLPNRKALLSNWDEFRTYCKQTEGLLDPGPIDIQSSEGVASDMDFALSFTKHDAVLSSGLEFIHDHFSHILLLIKYKARVGKDCAQYCKEQQAQKVIDAYQQIQRASSSIADNRTLEMLQVSLGAYTDIMASQPSIGSAFSDFSLDQIYIIWSNKSWKHYGEQRFQTFDHNSIRQIQSAWQQLFECEQLNSESP